MSLKTCPDGHHAMAFEKINQYTDLLVEAYRRSERMGKYSDSMIFLSCLTYYYETTLQTAKFKSQREYCKSAIQSLNPAYASGYFGAPKINIRKTRKA